MPSSLDLPIPLADIESVLAWVDTYKLSRPTKKINRDFSDAVLLAEILGEHYPKLVEMHNYPPRNSHALKLNNWMTLNRKVLKKLKLNLCCNTMEQLANCAPGVIERVLVMVRDKIQKDEEANKSTKDAEQNVSSGGSYYEACGDDENVLVVPVKTRVNGVLETIQQKVVNHQSYLNLKEELKDATDTVELLKQKVEHLDNLLKLKEQRIDELQKQLERKQSRRKEVDALQNSLSIQFDTNLLLPKQSDTLIRPRSEAPSVKSAESLGKISSNETVNSIDKIQTNVEPKSSKSSYIITPITNASDEAYDLKNDIDRIKSDVFKEAELIEDKNNESCQDREEFIDTEPIMTTIEDVIQKELDNIINPPLKEKDHINTSVTN